MTESEGKKKVLAFLRLPYKSLYSHYKNITISKTVVFYFKGVF